MFNQKELQENKNNINSLANDITNNILNDDMYDGESEDAIFDFFKKQTTEPPTEPPTQRPTQRPTSPPTERPASPAITEPEILPTIPPPEQNSQITPDIQIDPVIEPTEDSIQVIHLPALFFKPAAGYVSRHHNPDKPEYSIAMNDYRTHMGIDIDSSVGVNVKAVSDGIVSEIYDDPLMGKTVVVDHPDNIQSIYMNLQELLPKNIKVGAVLKGGDVIGGIGETSLIEISDVPHLHFEMKKDGNYVDPLDYIRS